MWFCPSNDNLVFKGREKEFNAYTLDGMLGPPIMRGSRLGCGSTHTFTLSGSAGLVCVELSLLNSCCWGEIKLF